MPSAQTGPSYGLKYQARSISAVKADTDATSFITGTLSLKEENEVHLLRLSSDGTEILCDGLFSHSNEIWHIASCPYDKRLFTTVHSTGDSFGASVWKIPEMHAELDSPQLETITSLDGGIGKINCVLWWLSGRTDKLISIDEENVVVWSFDSSEKTLEVISKGSAGMLHCFSGGSWDPHDVNTVASTCESSILFWDIRTMQKAYSVDCAYVRNIDYDPNREHIIATAEEESGIHIWDLRLPRTPIMELPGHTHWTWAISYNPEHTGVILSSGTDSVVNLWLASLSTMNESESGIINETSNGLHNPLLNSYTDYEDSVYGIAWSFSDPYIFASLSYDGRVTVESIKPFLRKK